MTKAALLPVLVQAALTFALLLGMGLWRVWLLQTRQASFKATALGQPAWPEGVTKVARAFQNQLETPMLFYAVVAFAGMLGALSGGFVAVEWVFVAFRLAHAAVHVTSNFVPLRFLLFSGALTALIVLWVVLALAAFAAP